MAILIYLIATFFVLTRVGSDEPVAKSRWKYKLIVFSIMTVVLRGDFIVGYSYMNYLCGRNDATYYNPNTEWPIGIRIMDDLVDNNVLLFHKLGYNHIGDTEGVVKTIKNGRVANSSVSEDRLARIEFSYEEVVFKIKRSLASVIDSDEAVVLRTYQYSWGGGWLDLAFENMLPSRMHCINNDKYKTAFLISKDDFERNR